MARLRNRKKHPVDLSTGRTLAPGKEADANVSSYETALIAAGVLEVVGAGDPVPAGPTRREVVIAEVEGVVDGGSGLEYDSGGAVWRPVAGAGVAATVMPVAGELELPTGARFIATELAGDTTIVGPPDPVDGQRLTLVIWATTALDLTVPADFYLPSWTPLETRRLPGNLFHVYELVYSADYVGGWVQVTPDHPDRFLEAPAPVVGFGQEGNPDPTYSVYTGIADTIYIGTDQPRLRGVGIFSFAEGQRATVVLHNRSAEDWPMHFADGGGAAGIEESEDLVVPAGALRAFDIIRADGALRLVAAAGAIANVELGYAEIVTNFQVNDAALHDVPGLSVTVDVGERPILVEFELFGLANLDAGNVTLASIVDDATETILTSAGGHAYAAGQGPTVRRGVRLNPAPGPHTYKVAINAFGGRSKVSAVAGAPSWLRVTEV